MNKKGLYLGVMGLVVSLLSQAILVIYFILMWGITERLKQYMGVSSHDVCLVIGVLSELFDLLEAFLIAFPIMILIYMCVRFQKERKDLLGYPAWMVLLPGAIIFQVITRFSPENRNVKAILESVILLIIFLIFQLIKRKKDSNTVAES